MKKIATVELDKIHDIYKKLKKNIQNTAKNLLIV